MKCIPSVLQTDLASLHRALNLLSLLWLEINHLDKLASHRDIVNLTFKTFLFEWIITRGAVLMAHVRAL